MLTRYRSNLEMFIAPDMEADSQAVLEPSGPPDPPAGRPAVSSDPSGALSAVLAWSSPPYDGGRCVDSYLVESRTESETEWRVVAERCHSLSVVVRGLEPGRRHLFRVRAENVHGLSEPSAASAPYCTPALAECSDDELSPPPFSPRHVCVEPLDEFAARYELLEELGKGRYGVVHRVTERPAAGLPGHTLAAKLIRTIKAKDRQLVHEEIAVMNLLRHPKLLQLAAAFEGPREMVMVTEYISGGELFERVVADDFTLTERDCILFMRQICEGVDYMHQNHVVHLDLKPENIMCQTRTSHHIKLIDFGLAQKLKPDTPVRVLFGTPEFIPPEIINYEPIGTESDMWSVGVICYVLLSGLSPFMGDNDAETFANITRADFDFDDEAFDAISQDAKDFISALLVKRKEKRLTARQCLEHPWLAQQPANMSCIALSTDKLKKFIIRRKWQKTGNAIRALGRMATLSAASRRNSAASGAGSVPGTPRHSLSHGALSTEELLASTPTRLARTAEEDGDQSQTEVLPEPLAEPEPTPSPPSEPESSPSLSPPSEPEPTPSPSPPSEPTPSPSPPSEPTSSPSPPAESCVDAVLEEAVTPTLVPRGRCRSERSDSGISDCSSASSRHREQSASAPAAALFGKKFSISEEADEPVAPVRPTDPPLCALASPAKSNGMSSTVSKRSAELLHKLASNSIVRLPAAAATAPAAPAAPAAAGVAAPERKAPAAADCHSPHKAAGVSRVPRAPLRSPTKTAAGFVESKIKSLESQSSSSSLASSVSITVVPPKEKGVSPRVSLRDTWGSSTEGVSPNRREGVSPGRREALSKREGVSPSRREVLSKREGVSPHRREALSPSKREGVSPIVRDALSLSKRDGVSPIRREALSSYKRDGVSPIRREALSSYKRDGVSPIRREALSPYKQDGVSPSRIEVLSLNKRDGVSPSRRDAAVSSRTSTRDASPSRRAERKAPLDTGLGPRRSPAMTLSPSSVHDSPPKSPTLRRMLGPDKLGAHSAGFQKTLEFWKR